MLFCYQVTKLCDLGPNDGVCSVQWTREGSYISIGTNFGQVQVASSLKLTSDPLIISYFEASMFYCHLWSPDLASVLVPPIGLGWDSVQEGPNYGRASNKNGSFGMEFAHFSFWKQGPEHTSTRSSGSK